MRKGRCPPGQRPLLPLFEMHAVFFVAAFTRFFILLCGIAESENGMLHDGLRQVKQCGLLFYAIHLRPCAEPHRAEAECIGAKRHILRGNGAVEVKVDGSCVTVKGPKGTLTQKFQPSMNIAVEGAEIVVTRPNDDKENRSLHGLTRTLIHNMIVGVTEGFKKELEVNGVGYRVQKQGTNLVMNLGFSHQVIVPETDEIKIDVPAPNKIIINGIDKQKVGQFAAEVREKRPPEPYKGKGIKYIDEVVRRKEGKTGKGK